VNNHRAGVLALSALGIRRSIHPYNLLLGSLVFAVEARFDPGNALTNWVRHFGAAFSSFDNRSSNSTACSVLA
jgi:hypothetical protein